jgi:thiol-disulfide isomerase/thioredoxin
MRFTRFLGTTVAITLAVISSPVANATQNVSTPKASSYLYNFTAKTTGGKIFLGKSLEGKATVLWFWAPWCTICRGESPDLVALAQSYKGTINLVGVAGLGPINDMKGFIKDTHTGNFLHLADVSGDIWNHFQIVSQPSFVFIRKSGVAYRIVGSMSKSDLFAMTSKITKNA